MARTTSQKKKKKKKSKTPSGSPLHAPVVALFAELLLEVAQGETVAAHGPPVRDLLAAEEIRHHGLGAARPVATEALFALLPAERSQRGREGGVRALARPNQAKIRRYNGNGRSELRFFRAALGSVRVTLCHQCVVCAFRRGRALSIPLQLRPRLCRPTSEERSLC